MITKGKIRSEAYNRISQGLKEAIEYSKGNKSTSRTFMPKHKDVKLLQEIELAEQQIIDGKCLTSKQVEKRFNARYSK
jgi:hypothetical protein